jgi:hypothetical protein
MKRLTGELRIIRQRDNHVGRNCFYLAQINYDFDGQPIHPDATDDHILAADTREELIEAIRLFKRFAYAG